MTSNVIIVPSTALIEKKSGLTDFTRAAAQAHPRSIVQTASSTTRKMDRIFNLSSDKLDFSDILLSTVYSKQGLIIISRPYATSSIAQIRS